MVETSKFESLKSYFDQRPSDPIYHYTSQAGILGIVRNKNLWATNIHYLNDSSEFAHALDLVQNEIYQLEKRYTSDEAPIFNKMRELAEVVSNVHIFVFSFSENGDLLSQWRGYCGSGGGFSIGFEYSQLQAPLEKQGFSLIRCIYNPQEQIAIVRELVTKTFEAFRPYQKELENRAEPLYSQIVSKFIGHLVRIAPIFKNHAFYEEKEWRMVSQPISILDPKVAYRVGKSILTPYYNFIISDSNEPLRFGGIIVGPGPNNDLSMRAISNLLSALGINQHGGIRCSTVPFRGSL